VEVALRHGTHQVGGPHRRAREIGRVDADHGLDAMRSEQRHLPGDDAAPVVSDHDRLLDAERVEQAGEIADQMVNRVCVHRLRSVGVAIAALVRRNGVKSGLRQRPQLMPPRVPELGEAVTEQYREALSRLRDVHGDAVGRNGAMRNRRHTYFLGEPVSRSAGEPVPNGLAQRSPAQRAIFNC
jgi:hypothetical protein